MRVQFAACAFVMACAIAPQAQAGTKVQVPTRCSTFILARQSDLAQCENGVQLTVPSPEEFSAGQHVRLGLRTRSNSIPTIELVFDAATPGVIPDAVQFTVKSLNGQATTGNCSVTRTSRTEASVTCSAGMNGPPAGQLLVGHAATGDEAKLDELMVAARAGLALLNSQSAAPPRTATRSSDVQAQLSEDRRAIFGLLVGAKAPINAPTCRETDPAMPKSVPFCFSKSGTGFAMLAGEIGGISLEEYQTVGLRPVSLQVNDAIFDTRIASDVLVTLDLDAVIQQIRVTTWNAQHDNVLAMLIEKLGKPQRQDESVWRNNATGQVVARTPNFYWSRGDILASYTSRKAAALDATATPLGEVIFYSQRYQQLLDQIASRRNAPPPNRRKM